MNFEPLPAQIELRRSVREFAESEIAPHVLEWDEAQAFPHDAIRKLGERGYMGAIFPRDCGGAGLGYLEYAILIEELARVDPSIALILAAHTSLCTNHIFAFGNDDQKRRYVPKLASGEWLGCWSLTEPEAGSDAAGTSTRAELDGGAWTLEGAKVFTTNAHEAQVCIAMAVTSREQGRGGISAFIVERDTPGYRLGRTHDKLGMRASTTGEIFFENCRLPQSQMLGAQGQGFIDSLKILDCGRITLAALSVGVAQGAYDAALEYSRHRRQFGRAISEFQAIQFKLVDMAASIEAARLLTYKAASRKDQGCNVTADSAIAKLAASETAVRVAGDAVQVLGGKGFLKEYRVEKFYRDAKLCTIGEGTSEIQRLVIARQLFNQ